MSTSRGVKSLQSLCPRLIDPDGSFCSRTGERPEDLLRPQPFLTASRPLRYRILARPQAEPVAAGGVNVQLGRDARPLQGEVEHHTVLGPDAVVAGLGDEGG